MLAEYIPKSWYVLNLFKVLLSANCHCSNYSLTNIYCVSKYALSAPKIFVQLQYFKNA